jgi:threonine aldolase
MEEKMIDLRSDTVTVPTPEMREVMAKAEVGDDVYGEDPSINALQERGAEITAKEAALFVPSGSMANLVAVLAHTRPGDSVIMGEKAHTWLYESGGAVAVAGILPIIAGKGGTFNWEQAEGCALGGNVHMAPTTMVMMENTHNSGGGIIFPQEDIEEIGEKAGFWGFKTHIDGARIFNASIATGKSVKELAAPVDSVSFCLSKGLGAPVGSVLCGDKEFITRAHRFRKMLGGAMRQAGVLAAAGIYALDHHVERLKDDHDNARLLAEKLSEIGGVSIAMDTVQTNMVFMDVSENGLNAMECAAELKKKGVLVNGLGKRRIRAVTHLGVNRDDILEAAEIFKEVVKE